MAKKDQVSEPQLSFYDTEYEDRIENDSVVQIPLEDNVPGALSQLLLANQHYRASPWPKPFGTTKHELRLSDARELSWIENESVHLIVTSPPYWILKEYEKNNSHQMGDILDYESFLEELDRVWMECHRVLVPGGRICCVVGDVCVPRRRAGRHLVMPLHSDIQVRARTLGLDCLTPIIWHKIANGVTEVSGNGSGFYGKPYQPGAVIKNDVEYVLFLRKGGQYRSASPLQKALSMIAKDEMQAWLRSIWTDIRGSSTRKGHPAPFPVELAERLIRLFSFAGDTVLDPFVGAGSTSVASLMTSRNSIGSDIERMYLTDALQRLLTASHVPRYSGAIWSTVCHTGF